MQGIKTVEAIGLSVLAALLPSFGLHIFVRTGGRLLFQTRNASVWNRSLFSPCKLVSSWVPRGFHQTRDELLCLQNGRDSLWEHSTPIATIQLLDNSKLRWPVNATCKINFGFWWVFGKKIPPSMPTPSPSIVCRVQTKKSMLRDTILQGLKDDRRLANLANDLPF
jgi:hypothetical protein